MDLSPELQRWHRERIEGTIIDLEYAMKELVDALVKGTLGWIGFKQWMVRLIMVSSQANHVKLYTVASYFLSDF